MQQWHPALAQTKKQLLAANQYGDIGERLKRKVPKARSPVNNTKDHRLSLACEKVKLPGLSLVLIEGPFGHCTTHSYRTTEQSLPFPAQYTLGAIITRTVDKREWEHCGAPGARCEQRG